MLDAIAEGLVEGGELYQIGVRGGRGSADDDALARAHEHTVISADAVGERGVRGVCAELRERIGARPVYATLDVDAIDPAFAPGTGTPVPGALSAREARALARGLARLHGRGADVADPCPAADPADVRRDLAAH